MHNNNKPRRPNNAMGGGGQHRHNNNTNRPRRFTNNRPQEGGNDAASVSRTRRMATQNREKYQMMAQSALSAGDRVLNEYYLQHAEHYHRVLSGLPPEEAPRPQYLRGHNPNEQQQGADQQQPQEASAGNNQEHGGGANSGQHSQHADNSHHSQHNPENQHAGRVNDEEQQSTPVHAQHDLPPFLTQPSNAAE